MHKRCLLFTEEKGKKNSCKMKKGKKKNLEIFLASAQKEAAADIEDIRLLYLI